MDSVNTNTIAQTNSVNTIAQTLLPHVVELIKYLVEVFQKEPQRPASNAHDEKIRELECKKAQLEAQLEESNRDFEEKARLQEQLEVANRALKEKLRLQEQRQRRRAEMRIDTNKFNFGITGRSGVGKSSLINALRNSRNDADGIAVVSEIECTAEMTAFPHLELPNLIFWDMPGAGPVSNPLESYYEDHALDAFDAIIIVVDGRLQQIDVEIAMQAHDFGVKHIILVLSKADMHIKNRVQRIGTTMKQAAESFRHEVRQMVARELSAPTLSDIEMFIVSSYAFSHPNEELLSPHPESSYINYTREGRDASLEEMDEGLLLRCICRIGEERLVMI